MKILAKLDLVFKLFALGFPIIGYVLMQTSSHYAELAALIPFSIGILLGIVFFILQVITGLVIAVNILKGP